MGLDPQLAPAYHRDLPLRIRDYLRNGRGLSNEVIDSHLLGWNGERITIPIFDREGKLTFFKLAKDPEDHRNGPKMLASRGSHAELYGWEHLPPKSDEIIICEGEFDRLVLESRGFPAVTSTGGAITFLPAWGDALRVFPHVYVCFDRDEAGREGAIRVLRLIDHARVVELPEAVGNGGDVTDYFIRLGSKREDFVALLHAARRPELPMPEAPAPRQFRPENDEVAALKQLVPIATVIGGSVQLRQIGERLVGRCPFHQDVSPSFVVFTRTQTFHCFGCGAHGDAITFLRQYEDLSFLEALQKMRQLLWNSPIPSGSPPPIGLPPASPRL